jgi:hypothetical protein
MYVCLHRRHHETAVDTGLAAALCTFVLSLGLCRLATADISDPLFGRRAHHRTPSLDAVSHLLRASISQTDCRLTIVRSAIPLIAPSA